MSGPIVWYYLGESGEVLVGPTGTCATAGPDITDYKTVQLHGNALYVDANDPPATVPGSIDFDIGYATALKDVLAQIVIAGKQNLVQWLEKKLEEV